MKGCLGLLVIGILFLWVGGCMMQKFGCSVPKAMLLACAVFFGVFMLGVLFAMCSKKKPATEADEETTAPQNIPSAPPADDPRMHRIFELNKEVTAKKKVDPDGAIQTLEQIERLQRGISMHPQYLLDTRLRKATILYENGRFAEAESLLLSELASARCMKISEETVAEADRQYRNRLDDLKRDREISGEAPKDWELMRNGNEWPDFERNLYCSAIYTKLRIFYTKAHRQDLALTFAMAEAHSRYENSTQQAHIDNPTPDFTTVEKLLRQLKNEEDIPQWKAFLLEYTKSEPTCERCWEMIDAITASAEDANDQQVAGK